MKAEQDDKTVACLINTSGKFKKQKTDFFLEPKWEELKQALNRKLYGTHGECNDEIKAPDLCEEDSKEPIITRKRHYTGYIDKIYHFFKRNK